MTNSLVSELLGGIRSPSSSERARVAEEVTDVHKGLSTEDVATVAVALVSARLAETDLRAQEAQLNALSELVAWHVLDAGLLVPLKALRDGRPLGGQEEYLEDLIGVVVSDQISCVDVHRSEADDHHLH